MQSLLEAYSWPWPVVCAALDAELVIHGLGLLEAYSWPWPVVCAVALLRAYADHM